MTSQQISEEVLSLADDISLSDLMNQPELANLTVRFVCGVRKTLFSHTPEGELAEIESLISRIYHRIGNERRSEAFAAAPAREHIEKAPTPEPVPARPTAPDLTLEAATQKARNVIQSWISKDEPKKTFTFDEVKRAVANIHTTGGSRDWSASDAETVSSGAKRWEQTLQTAMRKLRDADEIHYRVTKGDYFVLL